MEEWGLPGLKARYEFVEAGESVELRLVLGFDAEAEAPKTVRSAWIAFGDHLAGGPDGKPPPAKAQLVTSLAVAPLTATAGGVAVGERLSEFTSAVIAGLDRLASATPSAELIFELPKADIAKLPGDVFDFVVRMDLGAGRPAAALRPLLEEAVAFAAGFETVWQGFDGEGGRIAIADAADEASGEASGEAGLCCVRMGPKSGIALALPAEAEASCLAVPPLSTIMLSGTVEGDEGLHRFQDIDLDRWWEVFTAEFERMAIAEGGDGLRPRFERTRRALAGALAGRLSPFTGMPAGGEQRETSQVYRTQAEADLRSHPIVESWPVEVSRGAGPPEQPALLLRGGAAMPVGTAGGPAALPGAVRLAAGRQRLVYAVAAREDARTPPIRFEGKRIERDGDVPLRLLLRAADGTDAFAVDFGPQLHPAPLIVAPHPSEFSAAAMAASGDAGTVATALDWSVAVETWTAFSGSDRLELGLGSASEGEAVAEPRRDLESALFQALGRIVLFAGSEPGEPAPDRIERFAALAEAVAEALPDWNPPPAEVGSIPGRWCYDIDFGDLPALNVSRRAADGGRLPPWPEVAGFIAPVSDESSARYEPEAGAEAGAGLRLTLPGLRLLSDRAVRLHGRTVRNAGAVDPAFVYRSAIRSSAVLSPRLEWKAPQPEPRARSLEAALGALLRTVDGDSGGPYALGFKAALVCRPAEAGAEPIETQIPLLLLPRVELGGDSGLSVDRLTGEIAAALSSARAGIEADGGPERSRLRLRCSSRSTPALHWPS
jgi:hypothetical protein